MTGHVAGLVLAAGSSRRLGQPKQLLAYRGRTLLDATLQVARCAPFAQRVVTVGGAAERIRSAVDLSGFDVVESVRFTEGCSSSIVSALDALHPDTEGLVLLLGDQPGVVVETIETLISAGGTAPIAVCEYDNGLGHPFWFGAEVFDDLAALHGDKAVWKLLESGRFEVQRTRIPGDVPLDVDTWHDYELLLAAESVS